MIESMRIPSTDGVELALHDLGGDGPTLLVAHATGFCATAYQPMANRLADRFHVLALDFRGHGDSTAPDSGSYDWTGMVDDVLAVTATFDGPVLGFGHSMGGACVLAAERQRPGTFRRAFVFEPIVIPDEFAQFEPTANPLADSARHRRPTFPDRPAALSRYASRRPLGVFRADALFHYVEGGFADTDDGEVTLKCRPEVEAAVFEATGKPTSTQLAEVAIPVTLAIGRRDQGPGPAEFGLHSFAHLPNGRLAEYPAIGHFGPFQDPDLIAEHVLDDFAT